MTKSSDRVEISVADFIKLATIVNQRDTEARAKKAMKSYLKVMNDSTHLDVAISIFNGKRYASDGNTRAWLWRTGFWQDPGRKLSARIIYCATMDELIASYDLYDSPESVKTKRDYTFGAFRASGYIPKSAVLRSLGDTALAAVQASLMPVDTPVSVLRKSMNRNSLIETFAAELRDLDEVKPTQKDVWPNGILAGALIALKRYADRPELQKVKTFLRDYQANAGTKKRTRCNGVHALRSLHISQKQEGGDGFTVAINQAKRTLFAIEIDLAGRSVEIRQKMTLDKAEIAGVCAPKTPTAEEVNTVNEMLAFLEKAA